MTKQQFYAEGHAISERANVLGDFRHGYFLQAAPRIYQCCHRFGLFDGKIGDVLEIGPFYGYAPFILKKEAKSYTVIDGNDSALDPLLPLYGEAGIAFTQANLYHKFGDYPGATKTLPIPDATYDTVLCWETMEHFNFNPVKFVRELHRILKPGGKVCITVPNRASFQSMAIYFFGRGEKYQIDYYFAAENHEEFLGFHWREYTPTEAAWLFKQAGFTVEKFGTFAAFQGGYKIGFLRKLGRFASKVLSKILPRFGTNVYLIARK